MEQAVGSFKRSTLLPLHQDWLLKFPSNTLHAFCSLRPLHKMIHPFSPSSCVLHHPGIRSACSLGQARAPTLLALLKRGQAETQPLTSAAVGGPTPLEALEGERWRELEEFFLRPQTELGLSLVFGGG